MIPTYFDVTRLTHLRRSLLFATFLVLLIAFGFVPKVVLANTPLANGQLGDVCYAVADERDLPGGGEDQQDTLTTLNRVTAANDIIGLTGTSGIEAITFGPSLNLYAADGDFLGILNLTTAAFTPLPQQIGTAGGSLGEIQMNNLDGLAYSLDLGIFFGALRRSGGQLDLLIAIDPVTGAHIPEYFGPGNDYVVVSGFDETNKLLTDIDDMAFNPVTGDLYAAMNSGGAGGILVIIDLATGTTTRIATFRYVGNGEIIDDIEGISFYNDGSLYASTGNNFGTDPDDLNKLFQIDPVTGLGVLIGPFPTGPKDYEALACLTAEAAIVLKKYTNGPGQEPADADTPTGPEIQAGETVTWTYIFTNTGVLTLTNLSLVDDQIGSIGPQATCIPTGTILGPGDSLTCTATGVAQLGQYANMGTVTGQTQIGTPPTVVTDTNPSHYFGVGPGIAIKKFTNGEDADTPTGPVVPVGSPITWTYEVSNTGNVALSNVTVTDNIPGVNPVYVSGDANTNNLLDLTEIWFFRATGVAVAGQYANIGTTTGTPPTGPNVTDDDPSHYFGVGPGIVIKKFTNGEDADTPTGPVVNVGSTVTWTYEVRNTGNVPLSNVTVTDNIPGVNPVYVSGDANTNNLLDLTEIWWFRATGIAVAGQYANIGTTTGTPPTGPNVTDDDPSHYFGLNPQLAALGDRVWVDENKNGAQDDGEANVEGVKVTLFNGNDQQVGVPTFTNADGIYSFVDLAPGAYYVVFDPATLPVGFTFTTQNASGVPEAADSDADATGKTPSVTLAAGQIYLDLDAGIVSPVQPLLAALGDFVWFDANKNGLQDVGEAGVPNVKVDLFTSAGVFVKTDTTDADGKYLFTDLQPGSYYVEFATVPGHPFTKYNVNGDGNNPADSNPLVPQVEVSVSDGGEEGELGKPLTYTFSYSNTDSSLPASNVVISTTVPVGASFVATGSTPDWFCTSPEAGGICTLTISLLDANTSGSATFIVLLKSERNDVPNPLNLSVGLTHSSLARTQDVTLAAGETNLTVDAGIVQIGASLETPTPTKPTGLPGGPQPGNTNKFIYLPSVQTQE